MATQESLKNVRGETAGPASRDVCLVCLPPNSRRGTGYFVEWLNILFFFSTTTFFGHRYNETYTSHINTFLAILVALSLLSFLF